MEASHALLKNKKSISTKRIFKTKLSENIKVRTYKDTLVSKGYNKKIWK